MVATPLLVELALSLLANVTRLGVKSVFIGDACPWLELVAVWLRGICEVCGDPSWSSDCKASLSASAVWVSVRMVAGRRG